MKRRDFWLLVVASVIFVALCTLELIPQFGISYIWGLLATSLAFVIFPIRTFIFVVNQVRKHRRMKELA